jgi:hypothetical protein
MRVVTGDAIKLILTFGEASTPGESGCLEPNGRRIFGQDFTAARAVALAAHLDQPCAGRHGGLNDRPIGKFGLDCQKVVSPRTVTLLAADRSICCARPGGLEDRPGTGHMAEKTAPNAVLVEWPAQEFHGL